jgi:hypothetical protein
MTGITGISSRKLKADRDQHCAAQKATTWFSICRPVLRPLTKRNAPTLSHFPFSVEGLGERGPHRVWIRWNARAETRPGQISHDARWDAAQRKMHIGLRWDWLVLISSQVSQSGDGRLALLGCPFVMWL